MHAFILQPHQLHRQSEGRQPKRPLLVCFFIEAAPAASAATAAAAATTAAAAAAAAVAAFASCGATAESRQGTKRQ